MRYATPTRGGVPTLVCSVQALTHTIAYSFPAPPHPPARRAVVRARARRPNERRIGLCGILPVPIHSVPGRAWAPVYV